MKVYGKNFENGSKIRVSHFGNDSPTFDISDLELIEEPDDQVVAGGISGEFQEIHVSHKENLKPKR